MTFWTLSSSLLCDASARSRTADVPIPKFEKEEIKAIDEVYNDNNPYPDVPSIMATNFVLIREQIIMTN
jgi:hypothetical protein